MTTKNKTPKLNGYLKFEDVTYSGDREARSYRVEVCASSIQEDGEIVPYDQRDGIDGLVFGFYIRTDSEPVAAGHGTVEYRDVYYLDGQKLEAKRKKLRAIERRMARDREKFGLDYGATQGAQLFAIAANIGSVSINEKALPGSLPRQIREWLVPENCGVDQYGRRVRTVAASDLKDLIDGLARRFAEAVDSGDFGTQARDRRAKVIDRQREAVTA